MDHLGWTDPAAFEGAEDWTCPSCDRTFPEWKFGMLGACGLNVFCPNCQQEFCPETGELHDESTCEECCWEPTEKQLELEID